LFVKKLNSGLPLKNKKENNFIKKIENEKTHESKNGQEDYSCVKKLFLKNIIYIPFIYYNLEYLKNIHLKLS